MTIELMDIDPEDDKKVDEAKKWSEYKERYADITMGETKPKTPVYLGRNRRMYMRRAALFNKTKRTSATRNHQANRPQDEDGDKSGDDVPTSTTHEEEQHNNKSNFDIFDAIEKKLNERAGPPERRQSERRSGGGYDVEDNQECFFKNLDSKIVFVVHKDSFLYKLSALRKARKAHPLVTKRKSSRFRQWLRRWGDVNVSDAQSKRCLDWLMGRGADVVPNRTRVLTDNDISRTPYVPYNRYRVERLTNDATATAGVVGEESKMTA